MVNRSVVELHVPDFGPIEEFYSKLGFQVVWKRNPEGAKGYLVLELEGNVICFWGGSPVVLDQGFFRSFPPGSPRGYAVEIVLMIENVGAYYAQISKWAEIAAELTVQPWGVPDFRLADPMGFYLRITEPYDVLDPKYAVP